MSERFYINCPLQPGPIVLSGPEAHHLAVVCRLRPGDAVCLFNGNGREYPARVVESDRRSVEIDVLEERTVARELPFSLVVAAPLPKGDRAQFLLEKLTEIGVTRFVPLATERSVVHPRGIDKLQRYVIEASKQCGRNVLMQVRALTSWEAFCRREDLPGMRLLGDPGGATTAALHGGNAGREAVVLAVGPEGGFTTAEIATATAAGWTSVNLGPRTLRIETAALALASWIILCRSSELPVSWPRDGAE